MTTTRIHIFCICLAVLLCLTGCGEEAPQTAGNSGQTEPPAKVAGPVAEPAPEQTAQATPERQPPRPPLLESFQGEPQLFLFPRVGAFQPPPGSEQFPSWQTAIDQLVKYTGVAENAADGSRAWVFRGISSTDSVGYFAPVAVEPGRIYQVTFKLTADLPAGASAGIDIVEFDEFLWIKDQYTAETHRRHVRGTHQGRRLTGKGHGMQAFAFATGQETRMVHLVLYREGSYDDNSLMFDDIGIR